ncbi:hypothetical protein GN316_05380 [Xylophilus sp. Kf1]|nr:hypothetical protein [Xylophilus sp. Kf1]
MSLHNTTFQTIAAHQQRLMNLDAGSELRCRKGAIELRFTHSGTVVRLSAGQAIRVPDTQCVGIASVHGGGFWLEQPVVQKVQTQKDRQGLVAMATRLWRSFSTAT